MHLEDEKKGQGKGGGDRGKEDWEEEAEWRAGGGWNGRGRGWRAKSTVPGVKPNQSPQDASKYLERSSPWPACARCPYCHPSWSRRPVCLKGCLSFYRKTAGIAASSLGKESETPTRPPPPLPRRWCSSTWSSRRLWREDPEVPSLPIHTPGFPQPRQGDNSEPRPLSRQQRPELFRGNRKVVCQ